MVIHPQTQTQIQHTNPNPNSKKTQKQPYKPTRKQPNNQNPTPSKQNQNNKTIKPKQILSILQQTHQIEAIKPNMSNPQLKYKSTQTNLNKHLNTPQRPTTPNTSRPTKTKANPKQTHNNSAATLTTKTKTNPKPIKSQT